MSSIEHIDSEIKQALKSGDKERLTVLRGLKSDLKYRQIEKHDDLTEEDVIAVLSSAAKKLRDSIEQFKAGGRQDLVDKETRGLEIVQSFLPKQMSEDELRGIIKKIIEETGADSPQKAGLVMKSLMPEIKGKADGKLANRLVMEMLAN
jgi:uncharacterized protein YqeY